MERSPPPQFDETPFEADESPPGRPVPDMGRVFRQSAIGFVLAVAVALIAPVVVGLLLLGVFLLLGGG